MLLSTFRPFQCEHCTKCFYRSNVLKAHMKLCGPRRGAMILASARRDICQESEKDCTVARDLMPKYPVASVGPQTLTQFAALHQMSSQPTLPFQFKPIAYSSIATPTPVFDSRPPLALQASAAPVLPILATPRKAVDVTPIADVKTVSTGGDANAVLLALAKQFIVAEGCSVALTEADKINELTKLMSDLSPLSLMTAK